MSEPDHPAIAAVDRLAPAFGESGLDELELELGELRVRLARPPAVAAQPATPAGQAPPAAPRIGVPSPFGEPAAGMRFVVAPLTGVWYASPSPGARPYVQVGDEIAPGRVIGLIEAMKLFNEIKADLAGRVRRVLVENGTLVKRQQPLVEVEQG